jgi:AcrR family transcriptional regulator
MPAVAPVEPDGSGEMTEADRSRPLRKDAVRNRELLLTAAREVFAERGLEASLDDVARRAGVGIGTAYRHFANKQELASALFEQHIEDLIDEATAAVTIADPWEALSTFFTATAEKQAHDRGLHQVLVGLYPGVRPINVREKLTGPITTLFDRAKKAGVLRADAEPTDAAVVFVVLGAVFDMSNATGTELWRRYLALFLDGLRATERPPLPAPALQLQRVDEAMAAAKPPQSASVR